MSSRESGNTSGRCIGFNDILCPYNAKVYGRKARCKECQNAFKEDEMKQSMRGLMRLAKIQDRGWGPKILDQMQRECD
jgi:hypothetical protein